MILEEYVKDNKETDFLVLDVFFILKYPKDFL